MARRLSGRRGFILIFAMMALATIGLMIASVLVGSQSRLRQTANIKVAAESEALADGVLHMVIAALWRRVASGSRNLEDLPVDGRVLVCGFEGGRRIDISLQDEGGKIDLNAANQASLEWLLAAIPSVSSSAARIARDILTFRDLQSSITRMTGYFNAEQLYDAISGKGDIVTALLPFVTVHTRAPGFDVNVLPNELRASMFRNGSLSAVPPELQRPSAGRAFKINVTAATDERVRFSREAVIEFGAVEGRPYAIREWGKGVVEKTGRDSPAVGGRPGLSICYELSAGG